MYKRAITLILTVMAVVGCLGVLLLAHRLRPVQAQARSASFAAIPGEKGGQDVTGPYEVVADWPKPLSQLPGHETWTWGSMQSIFAESPNRVLILMRGDLPKLDRPQEVAYPAAGPSLSFPVPGAPFRNASLGQVASPGAAGWQGKLGVDARWEHCLMAIDANGNITEQWTQWDSRFRHLHEITINPYDPQKHIWVVDDMGHAVYKFTNDGKQLVQTLGTPYEAGADDKHFARPTFLAWLPDSTLYVADGHVNTRVVKFDKDGKYLMSWGQKSTPPNDTRPGYFDNVHGVVIDPQTRRVYVTDSANRRIQVFDENGKFLDQFTTGRPSIPYFLYRAADGYLWVADNATSKIVKFDQEGHFLYSWGSQGEWPGAMWGPHGLSVDQQGNLYMAEVGNGRAQKFRPRAGANPDFVVGQPVRAAWR